MGLMKRVELEQVNAVMGRYGLKLLPDGTFDGPRRPKLYSMTPVLRYESSRALPGVLKLNEAERIFGEIGPIVSWPGALSIVAEIFEGIVGTKMGDFVKFVMFSRDDFRIFFEAVRPDMKSTRGVDGTFSALNLGGVVVIADTERSGFFPLALHEAGHCLYPDENDLYVDEFRAYFFQIVGTKVLENALGQIGVHVFYPDNTEFPSEKHGFAYRDAKILVGYLTYYDETVRGSDRAEQQLKRFLSIVRQPFRRIDLG